MKNNTSIVWLRRDLRLRDNAALAAAMAHDAPIALAFVFDRTILDALPSRRDRRVEFIWHALAAIDKQLARQASRLVVLDGDPTDLIPQLAEALNASRVICAQDYEPSALARDQRVSKRLQDLGRVFEQVHDHVLMTPSSVLTQAGKPYSIYTPYRKRWRALANPDDWRGHAIDLSERLVGDIDQPVLPSLGELGFEATNLADLPIALGEDGANKTLLQFADRIGDYGAHRDYPALPGPSYLSIHLRFGTLSIRQAAHLAWTIMQSDASLAKGAEVWLNELIWRDFYFQILHHFPHVVEQAFRAEMRNVQWVNDDRLFKAWCDGATGYPLVDAAMRQLNTSGYMHNRLRMVAASFLTKDLGIDWRRGEAYFARHLNDFELASNNGGWQWAASTGCDAQPYFRIFNPVTQSTRFDPRGRFIRRYVPELKDLGDKAIHAPWLVDTSTLNAHGITLGETYPAPVVDHAIARKETLARFEAARSDTSSEPANATKR